MCPPRLPECCLDVNNALVLCGVGQDASRPLEVVSAADPRFSSRVELSVRFGKTLLVLECDGVEPMLYPLARKDLVHQGPRYVVQVGDKVSARPMDSAVSATGFM